MQPVVKKHPVEENRVKMATQQLDCPDSFPWRYADVTAADGCVTSVLFSNEQKPTRPDAVTQACCQQLQAYFAGQRTTFDLPLAAGLAVRDCLSALGVDAPVRAVFTSLQIRVATARAVGTPRKSRSAAAK